MKLSILFLMSGLKVVSSIIGEGCIAGTGISVQDCSFGELCYRSKCIEGRPCTSNSQCAGYVYTTCLNGYCHNGYCIGNSYCVVGQICKEDCESPVYVNVIEGLEAKLSFVSVSNVNKIQWYKASYANNEFAIGRRQSFSEPEYYGEYCSGVSPCETPTRGIRISGEGDLIIERSNISDSGVYTCLYRQSSTVQYRYYGLYVYDSPQVAIEGIGNALVVEGTELRMNCTARSNTKQTLQFYWIIDGRNISGNVSVWKRGANGDVLVYSIYTYVVSREDHGKLIKCQVIPTYGNDKFAEENIEILYGPSGTPSIDASTRGDILTLIITPPSDSGNPPCTFSLNLDGKINYTSTIPEYRFYRVTDKYILRRYYCICYNLFGASDASEVVKVQFLGRELSTFGGEPTTLGGEPTTPGGEPTTLGGEPTTPGGGQTTVMPMYSSNKGLVIGLVAGLVVCVIVIVVVVIVAMVIYKRKLISTKKEKEETATSGTTAPKDNNKRSSEDDNEEYLQPKRQAVSVVSDYQELNEAVIGRGLYEEIRQSDGTYENVM